MRRAWIAILVIVMGACEGMGGHGHGGGGGGGGWSHASSSSSSGGGGGHSSEHSSGSSGGGGSHSHDSGPTLGSTTRAAVRTLAEALVATQLDGDPDPADEPAATSMPHVNGPLIDNHDPCNYCPEDLSCGQCVGAGNVVCTFAPAGAFARCASPI